MRSALNKNRGVAIVSAITGMVMLGVVALLFPDITREYAPPGQSLYVLSKLVAIMAFLLMWWQIMLGILGKLKVSHHIVAGLVIFSTLVAHAGLFATAVSIRQGELSLGMLVPDFSNYYHTGLTFGQAGLLSIIIAMVFSSLRRKVSYWRIGHGFVYLLFGLGTVHGLMIGSDINNGPFTLIVILAVVSLVVTYGVVKKQLILGLHGVARLIDARN